MSFSHHRNKNLEKPKPKRRLITWVFLFSLLSSFVFVTILDAGSKSRHFSVFNLLFSDSVILQRIFISAIFFPKILFTLKLKLTQLKQFLFTDTTLQLICQGRKWIYRTASSWRACAESVLDGANFIASSSSLKYHTERIQPAFSVPQF